MARANAAAVEYNMTTRQGGNKMQTLRQVYQAAGLTLQEAVQVTEIVEGNSDEYLMMLSEGKWYDSSSSQYSWGRKYFLCKERLWR